MNRRCLAWLAAAVWLLLVVSGAQAHEAQPATLSLRELEVGRFAVSFKKALSATGSELDGTPSYPAHCHLDGRVLDCRPRGLVGEIGFSELGAGVHHVLVQVEWLNGTRSARLLGSDAASLRVRGTPANASFGERAALANDYAWLGFFHILTGVDHLCFVVALTLLVGKSRRLILAVTAFTLAHSLTLAASVLGFASAPASPVEATIALSIVLVCAESLRPAQTLTRRAPWLVAFAFGLLHGFGFAGALLETGLPPHQAPLALLFFNVGVELGQMVVIAGVGLVALGLRGWQRHALWLERAVLYAMGGAASFWSLSRIADVFTN